MQQKLVFNLYAPCIPVEGKSRSVICDIYRARFRYIPNTLVFILNKFKGKSTEEIKIAFENKYDETIDEYFQFLEENDFGFYSYTHEQKLFPKLSLDFELPSVISNAIIDINDNSQHDYNNIFNQLEKLKCYFWQLRFYSAFPLDRIKNILNQRKDVSLRSIHLILKFHKENGSGKIKSLYNSYPISQIDIHSVPSARIKTLNKSFKDFPIHFHKIEIENESYCGKIKINEFVLNSLSFSESQQHNSCLNQKISIDVNGEIKNCPSMNKSFGNTQNTTLQEALDKRGFKDVWNIHKDKIAVCKDCEFRYICTDCRAYIENPDDMFSKPLKCGYNPYTTKWEEWSTSLLKQKAIEYYNLQHLVKQ